MTTKAELKEQWNKALIKIAMTPANWINGEKKESRQESDAFLIKTIPLTVAILSTASVTNMATRAHQHHPGVSAYATGIGMALLVPIGVYSALWIKSLRFKVFAWICAIFFAVISGSIQFMVYSSEGAITLNSLLSANLNLESFAFGFGVPIAECFMAALEGILLWQREIKLAADAQKQEESERAEAERVKAENEKQKAQEREDRILAEKIETERKEREAKLAREAAEHQAKLAREAAEWEAAQARIAAEHEQKLVLQREKALAKTVNKSGNKPAKKPVNRGVNESVNEPVNRDKNSEVDSSVDSAIDIEKLLEYYSEFPKSSLRKTGKHFGVSHTLIRKTLQSLEGKRVHVNGEVTVLKNSEAVENQS